MTASTQNPLDLIKGVVTARHSQEIEHSGYTEALKVLDQHFSVYEQRLQVMTVPASFPDGEVLLEAASQGLNQIRQAVFGLSSLDPAQHLDQVEALVAEAESGYGLLSQLQDVTHEKRLEFEEAYLEYQENHPETE